MTDPINARSTSEVLKLLRQSKWLVVSIVLLTMAVATMGLMLVPKLYRATASLLIERPTPMDMGIPNRARSFQEARHFAATQQEVLRSNFLLSQLAERLQLTTWTEYSSLSEEELLEELDSQLTIRQRGRSALVDLSFTTRNRDRVADMVNTLCEIYLDHYVSREELDLFQNISTIEAELPRIQKARDSAQHELEKLRSQTSLLSFDGRRELLQQEIAKRSQLLQLSRAEYDRLGIRKVVIESHLEKSTELESLVGAMEFQSTSELSRELLRLEGKYADARGNPGTQKDALASLKRQISLLQSAIKKAQDTELKAFSIRFEIAKAEWKAAVKRQRELETLAIEMDRSKARSAALESRIAADSQLIEQLLQRREELLVLKAGSEGANRIWIQDHAIRPSSPWAPNISLTLFIAMILGMMAAMAGAYARDRMNDQGTQIAAIESVADLSPIAWIPDVHAKSGDLRSEWIQGTGCFPADEFRKLLLCLGDVGSGPGKVIGVLSAIPNEGKTMVAAGLALCAARAGYRTLLVDGDLKRLPNHKLNQVEKSPGYIQFLQGKTLEVLIAASADSGLHVLTSGRPTEELERLMNPRRVSSCFREIREKYQVIVLDTSPMLLSSDALVFAREADEILLVTSAANSRMQQIRRALIQLKQAGLDIRGTVLNRVRTDSTTHEAYECNDTDQHTRSSTRLGRMGHLSLNRRVKSGENAEVRISDRA